jgi:diguanylate cyclase (GGDEF)-like protein
MRHDHRRRGPVPLRTRLAAAFFVLLLAPVVVLAGLVSAVVGAVWGPDPNGTAVRAVLRATCDHLGAEATSLAALARSRGESYAATPNAPDQPWALCGVDPADVLLPAGSRYTALAARAPIAGTTGAYAWAVAPLDPTLTSQLSTAAGCRVNVVALGAAPTTAMAPIPLACAPSAARSDLGWIAFPAGAVAVVLAFVLAWWLASLATRPLGALLRVVDRAVAGDLDTRTRVGGYDEAARLGAGLDRLVGDMREAQRLSVTDPLTGLGNLRRLREALHHEVERAARFRRCLGVLMLDLDHFKAVNDGHGHRAGDDVLVELARRVRAAVREVDLTFRQGGEEFVVLLPETDVAGSLTAARRIGEAIRETPFRLIGRDGGALSLPITVSVGVAVYPRHANTAAEVLDAADRALYEAKDAGRDTFAVAHADFPQQWPLVDRGRGDHSLTHRSRDAAIDGTAATRPTSGR